MVKFLVVAIALLALPAAAEDESWKAALGDPRETLADLREEVVRIPLRDATADEKDFPLAGTLYQPQGSGPFPVVVVNHGAPLRRADRDAMGRYRLIPQTRAWVDRGFAVLVPMRRGYGASPGSVADSNGGCESPQYARSGRESARDVLSAVDYIRTRPTLDASRVVLLGQSAGGFAVLAAAAQSPPGVLAVLNFAGGRGGNGTDGRHCAIAAMAETIAGYAATTRVPVLWLYSVNDKYFGPEASRAWFDAFEHAGGRGRHVLNPPIGEDGHLLYYKPEAIPAWSAATLQFFREFGIAVP